MHNLVKISFIAALALISTSCNLYKKYEIPEDTAITSEYKKILDQKVDSASLPYLSWEQVFRDPTLQSLIRTALSNNRNLDNARLNIEIAQAQLKGAKLSYFPSVAFAPNGGGSTVGGSDMNWTYQLPLSANWEIDAFGKILNTKRGAEVSVEQAEYYRQSVRSQIVCNVASCYYSLVLLHQQLALTKRTSEIWKEQVESMELMKVAARTNEAAVVQSRANYYNILSTIPDLEQQIGIVQNSLSLLLNTNPQKFVVTSELNFDLPESLINGVPMSYLAARPDVRAAERQMAIAFYATNRARANFYPSLSISPTGGFTNSLGSFVMNPGKWFFNLAGQLTAPLFSRGQNIANLEVAKVQQKQAMNTFENTVLSASADVSDALIKIRTAEEKRNYVLLQIDQLQMSVEYTTDLFTMGKSTTYLEVLTAQSGLLNAQMTSLACWHNKAAAIISLYQAVGGGR
ncbi:MAG: TolC family protein [Prevotella sp.]|nr:TolC family protein [Bacteroides sp.]MCM1365886.1 TolC family protein [Prevotella sp.]